MNNVDNNYIPEKGDMFEWCYEWYWCIERKSNYSGVVKSVFNDCYNHGFIWNYGGAKPKFIRKATPIEYERLNIIFK